MRILVVEDDPQVAAYVTKGLQESGYAVDHAADGQEGLRLATGQDYDAMIVDRMLPALDGLSIIKAVRGMGRQTPVIVLSALGDVDERVRGLRAGSDDYLAKPFSFSELLARLDALLRRSRQTTSTDTHIRIADLEIDLLARTVSRSGKAIELQPREFRLLEFLARHAGQAVTRTMLLEHVWDYHFDPQTNVIDVHISRLRSKIDKDFSIPLIRTVRGVGYMLDGTP
jgi:two-component system OmpR family response regulator